MIIVGAIIGGIVGDFYGKIAGGFIGGCLVPSFTDLLRKLAEVRLGPEAHIHMYHYNFMIES